MSSNASHSSKLDVFAVYADLNIHLAESDPGARDSFEIGLRVAFQLRDIALSLSYAPFHGISEYLLARCFLLQHRRDKPSMKGRRAARAIQEARLSADAAFTILQKIGDVSFREDIAQLNRDITEEMRALPKM